LRATSAYPLPGHEGLTAARGKGDTATSLGADVDLEL